MVFVMFNARHRCWAPFWGLGVRLSVIRRDCSLGWHEWTTWNIHLPFYQAAYRRLDLTRFINLSLSVGPRAVQKHSGQPAWEWHVANDGTAIIDRSAVHR